MCIRDSTWPAGAIDGTYMFRNCDGLTTPSFAGTDFSALSTCLQMFYSCANMTSIDLSDCDFSGSTTMKGMFYDDLLLETINMSGVDGRLVKYWDDFVRNDASLSSMNLSGSTWGTIFGNTGAWTGTGFHTIDLSGAHFISDANRAFTYNNAAVTSVDLTNAVIDSTSFGLMFSGATNLAEIDMSGIDISHVTTMQNMLINTPLTTDSYSDMLAAFASQTVQDGVDLDADVCTYNAGAASDRLVLTDPPNNWVIVDAGQV